MDFGINEYNMGLKYEYYRKSSDYKEAIKWYREAAPKGHVNAQVKLGIFYGMCKGVPTNEIGSVM